MSDFTLKVEGEKEVILALRKMLGTTEKEAKAIVANSGEKIRGDAKSVVPVVEGVLRNSLSRFINDNGLTVTVGTNVEYAPFVEYGTRRMIAAHGEHDPENPVTSWAAQRARGASGQQMPFLTPAFLRESKEFIKEITKAIESEVRKRK